LPGQQAPIKSEGQTQTTAVPTGEPPAENQEKKESPTRKKSGKKATTNSNIERVETQNK
jgi:hypothetical protein